MISTRDVRGVYYKDDLSKITEPSNPLNLVETTGYHMTFYGDLPSLTFFPATYSANMKKDELIFPHHRKLIWGLTAKTESNLKNDQDHDVFIRELIETPEEVYARLHERFAETNFASNTSVPEFLPVIRYLEGALFSERINTLSKGNPALL